MKQTKNKNDVTFSIKISQQVFHNLSAVNQSMQSERSVSSKLPKTVQIVADLFFIMTC